MRSLALAGLAAFALLGCRTYDNYEPIDAQAGLLPAARFARFGREQAELVAIGRSLAAWRMTADSASLSEQAARAACFARRLPDVASVDTDPLGYRLTVKFKSGWRAAAIPIDDGVEPTATPGLPPLLPAPAPGTCS
jgi:hypothetical protein